MTIALPDTQSGSLTISFKMLEISLVVRSSCVVDEDAGVHISAEVASE